MSEIIDQGLQHATRVEEWKVELEGPYECGCGGHLMIDATYLDQVGPIVTCPYCTRALQIPED